MRFGAAAIVAALWVTGCADSTVGADDGGAGAGRGDGGGGDAARIGPRVERDADPGGGPGDGAAAEDAASPGGDAATGPDAAPPPADGAPACQDEDCGPGRVCYDGRCIDGTRCADTPDCPGGRVCIARICIGDPAATGGLVAEPDLLIFTFSARGERAVRNTVLVNQGDAPITVTELRFEGAATFALGEAPERPFRLVPMPIV